MVFMPEYGEKEKVPDTGAALFRSMLGWAVAFLVGAAGVLFVKFFDFPKMLAAQTTIGIFGFVGGLSHSLLIRDVGGKVTWKQCLFISLVWAFSCIGSITPLFFVLGTPLKMTIRAFYCFAIFGALGGTVSAFMMRSFFVNDSSRDIIPCVLIWSFSFGLAAIVNNTIGELLQSFLPAVIAWSIAFVTMALIIGAGGGYSIVHQLSAGRGGRKSPVRHIIDHKAPTKEKNESYILTIILLSIPFYINDLSNIYVMDWRVWIAIDYTTVKLFPFVIVLCLICTKIMKPSDFGLSLQPLIPFIIVFLVGTLAGLLIEQNGYLLLSLFPGYPPLKNIPLIESPVWNWIDLTLGLLMVGIFEELVFRGYLSMFLARYTRSRLVIIGISAVAFGLIHWSGGLHKVVVTGAVGAVFMALYLRTRSLPAIMLAHFTINFIDFAGVIPKSIFRFF